jgi:anti-sigma factor RsiW
MNCADLEILICDYADGTLGAAEMAEVEAHLAECPGCAEMAEESAAAMKFMERAAAVEPPPQLVTRILFDAPWRKQASPAGARRWLDKLLGPVLQPRFVMGMAMTVLSFSVLFTSTKLSISRQDLEPGKVWASLEDRASRTWARTVKYYDNLKVVYQIQTMLHEWQQEDEEQQRPQKAAPASQPDEHKLPANSGPAKSR